MPLDPDFILEYARHLDLPTGTLDPERVTRFVNDLWTLAAGLDTPPAPPAPPEPALPPATTTPPAANPDAPWHEADQTTLSPRIRDRELSVTALTAHMLDRIHRHDPDMRAYITVADDHALEQAAALDAELERGRWRGPLHGVLIGVKDNTPVAGLRWTANSRVYEHRVATRDARAVARLRRAGAVILGKHNLNEFGWSIPSETDLAPPPRNPWFPAEYAVGSSSGGGAAVAARLATAAVGTDGGGSTRLPAGQEGLFGLKPGLNVIPRDGYADGHLSLSEIGLMARSATDVAALLAAATTPEDASDDDLRARVTAALHGFQDAPRRLRVGTAVAYVEGIEPEPDVLDAYHRTIQSFRDAGFTVDDVPAADLPALRAAVAANFVALCTEAYADHARTLKSHASLYGDSARHYLVQGAFLPATLYLNALETRERVRAQVNALLDRVDVLLLPTSPVTTTTAARNPATHRKGGNAMFTAPFNLTGHAGLSFPAALSAQGIPIGMQLVGRPGSELELLRAAHAVANPPREFPDLDRLSRNGGEA